MEMDWTDIFKDVIDARVQDATVEYIRSLMQNMQLTVEKAMDALSIPQNQRATYAGLV